MSGCTGMPDYYPARCNQQPKPKKPKGLVPESIWLEKRKDEVADRKKALYKAIKRYAKADMGIPITWAEEYNRHTETLENG